VMIARIYNHLPAELNQIESEESFVCSLTNLLSEKDFYDIEEFLLYKF
jgi:hypothetical protein